ncbi:hypothetical protein TPY_1024 [Sulfobacillus acidophilus TPY]|uniref:Rhodanese-like protein n=1 Tax=Sulfobacillus acidophilus (strain ATCC 700253 / DSM 10332 / NAL) TaxID=679936 RepID=G8TX84_SULAD|nr:hypothetical protein TPY_1024 [Sulfobacillus acidophilus TPY]AEW06086.1 Rhodanese-like protein [Sulfobacillus acidophilus DSM 10332]
MNEIRLGPPLGDQIMAMAERYRQSPEDQLNLAVKAFLTLSRLGSPAVTGLLPGDFRHMLRSGWQPTIIDVDDREEYHRMRLIPSANIPLLELWAREDEIPQSDNLVFVCQAGIRSRIAAGQWTARHETPAFFLEGGLVLWARLGLPWEIDESFPSSVSAEDS